MGEAGVAETMKDEGGNDINKETKKLLNENAVFRRVVDLHVWRNRMETFMVVSCVNMLYYLLFFKHYSLFSLIIIMTLSIHVFSLFWFLMEFMKQKLTKKEMGTLAFENSSSKSLIFDKENTYALAECLSLLLNFFISCIRDWIIVPTIRNSAIVIVSGSLLIYLGTLLGGATIVYFGVLSVFVFSRVLFGAPNDVKND